MKKEVEMSQTCICLPPKTFNLTLLSDFASLVLNEQVQATSTGRITAVPFWYHIYLDEEISVSTLGQAAHWKQAAVVLQQPLEVRAGEWVRLAVKLHKSTISILAHIESTPQQME